MKMMKTTKTTKTTTMMETTVMSIMDKDQKDKEREKGDKKKETMKADNVLQLCCSYLWVRQWKSTFYVRPLGQVELSFDISSGSIYGQFGQSSSKEFCFLSHAKEDEWIKDVCGHHFMYRQNGKTSKSI